MSFHRRRKTKANAATPELSVLLAEMSARQGASRTAFVQSSMQASTATIVVDPLIEIFAPAGQTVAQVHRFSDQIANPVIPRQLK